MTLYNWPQATAFGRVIPKDKIHKHAGSNSALKNVFVREVDRIVWSHKLAPETINLPATKKIAEIQVLRISLRTTTLDHRVLRSIDQAIPSPLFFELVHDSRVKFAAAHKRPSEANNARWVVGDYYQSIWHREDAPRRPLPVALTMGVLYERLLSPLIDEQTTRLILSIGGLPQTPQTITMMEKTISLDARIAKAKAVMAQAREVEQIKARLAREKQFNKRVAINANLRTAKQVLKQMVADIPSILATKH